MLFTIATILWIIVLIISISNTAKKKQPNQQSFQQLKSYPIGSVTEDVTNGWIILYIKNKGGKVSYNQLKEDFTKYLSNQLDIIVINMVNDKLINHGIDTNLFEEYIELKDN